LKKSHTNLWINWEREYTSLVDRKAVLVNEIEAKEEFLKSLNYWISEMATIQEQKQNALQWDAWTKEYDTIIGERDYAAWNIQRMELEADMHNNKQQIEIMDKCVAIDAKIASLNRMLAYRTWKAHDKDISLLRKEESDILEQLARNRYIRDGLTTKIEEHKSVLSIINDIQGRLNKLQEFHRRFIGNKQDEGFKSYIYKDKVLPLIETEVNQFISTIDTFRLKIRVKNSKFIFMLEDRGNTPTLDHASGYQKFVVGLAMRVALSRIGAVGQNLRHLFLDEGFTACDSINIQKTGELLRDIMFMAGYKSMIIMSHLDTIRDASDLQIQIQRNPDGRSSRIQLGEKRDPIPKGARRLPSTDVPAKKRGRPRKTA
jgi:DNA repair exonuclease SbcCD ATPase subunit